MSFDTVATNCAFAEQGGFGYTLLADTDRRLALAYGAASDPGAGFARRVSFLIDERGVVLKTYSQVNPGAHPAAVLRDLDAFGAAPGARSADDPA